MGEINKKLKKLENKNNKKSILKKFRGDGEVDTLLEPYIREKIDIRDIDSLIEDDVLEEKE